MSFEGRSQKSSSPWRRGLILGVGLLCSPISDNQASAQSSDLREAKIKAAFVFNFVKFVEWPETAIPESPHEIVIGVLGDDPTGNLLLEAVKGKTVNDRPVATRKFEAPEDIVPCHVLFIGPPYLGNMDEIVEILNGGSTLTIGPDERFIEKGCHIAFTIKDNKVRFLVNKAEAERVGIRLSSKILKIAERIIG